MRETYTLLPAQQAESESLSTSSPEEIKAEIARTRTHMDEGLSALRKKFKPEINMKRIPISAISAVIAIVGLIIFRAARPRAKLKARAKVTRLKVRSAGIFDYLRMVGLVTTVARKGKPGVFIVQPRKA